MDEDEAPRLYDILHDSWRNATQIDVERLARSEQVLGMAIRYLRSSTNPIDRNAAQMLVDVAQQKLEFSIAYREITDLANAKA